MKQIDYINELLNRNDKDCSVPLSRSEEEFKKRCLQVRSTLICYLVILENFHVVMAQLDYLF